MFSRKLRNFAGKTILSAASIFALAVTAPALGAQAATMSLRAVSAIAHPATASYDALPEAVTPANAAKYVPVSLDASQSFSTIHIPESNAKNFTRQVGVESMPSRRAWMALAAASSAAAAFDAYSTRRSIESGNVEANPFMKPFAGGSGIYVALQASPLAMDYVAYRMQRSHSSVLRHMWWLPQSTGTALSILAGAHNMSISR